MSITALIPYRSIAAFCLIASTGTLCNFLFGLGAATTAASVGVSSIVILGLLVALQIETHQYKYLSAASMLALLRTWLVLSIVVYVLNSHFGASGIGARMIRHLRFLRWGAWLIDAMWTTVAIAVVDISLGALQVAAARSSGQ